MSTTPSLVQKADRTGIPLAIARLVLGGMFVYLGTLKLMDPLAFLKTMESYGFFQSEQYVLLNTVAVTLPYLEVLCGVMLILGLWIRGPAILLGVMLLVFYPPLITRALSIAAEDNLSFCDVKFDCGCGTGVVAICPKLLENTILLLMAIVATLSRSRKFTLLGRMQGTSPADQAADGSEVDDAATHDGEGTAATAAGSATSS